MGPLFLGRDLRPSTTNAGPPPRGGAEASSGKWNPTRRMRRCTPARLRRQELTKRARPATTTPITEDQPSLFRFPSPSQPPPTAPASQIMDRVEKVEQRAASSRKIAGAPQPSSASVGVAVYSQVGMLGASRPAECLQRVDDVARVSTFLRVWGGLGFWEGAPAP